MGMNSLPKPNPTMATLILLISSQRRFPIAPWAAGFPSGHRDFAIVAETVAADVLRRRQEIVFQFSQAGVQLPVEAGLDVLGSWKAAQVMHLVGVGLIVVEQPGALDR